MTQFSFRPKCWDVNVTLWNLHTCHLVTIAVAVGCLLKWNYIYFMGHDVGYVSKHPHKWRRKKNFMFSVVYKIFSESLSPVISSKFTVLLLTYLFIDTSNFCGRNHVGLCYVGKIFDEGKVSYSRHSISRGKWRRWSWPGERKVLPWTKIIRSEIATVALWRRTKSDRSLTFLLTIFIFHLKSSFTRDVPGNLTHKSNGSTGLCQRKIRYSLNELETNGMMQKELRERAHRQHYAIPE